LNNHIEACRPSVVGIGHVLIPASRRKPEERLRLVLVASRRDRAHCRQVFRVHREQQVEAPEIRGFQLPGTQAGNVVPAHARMSLAAWIGLSPDVVAGRACRIELKSQVRNLQGREVPGNTLRGRRAADVPEADEEDVHPPAGPGRPSSDVSTV
jgi:hypothetical protein